MNRKLLIFLMLFMPFCIKAQTTYTVLVNNFSFSPATLVINQGDIVDWQNIAGFHNVNGSTGLFPTNPESFTSGAASSSPWFYSKTFVPIGTYQYICDIHPSMVGTIFVNGPLPVEMSHINVSVKQSMCTLEWETSFEDNIKEFIVQRSSNALDFKDINNLSPNHKASSYTYLDNMGSEQTLYYRIKIVDANNAVKLSPVRMAQNDLKITNNTLAFLPNPFINHFHIQCTAMSKFESSIEVYDMFGRILIHEDYTMEGGVNYIHLDKSSKLSRGNYLVIIKNKSAQEILTGIITKQ